VGWRELEVGAVGSTTLKISSRLSKPSSDESSSSEAGMIASLLMGWRTSGFFSGVLKRSGKHRLEDDCGEVAFGDSSVEGRGLSCVGGRDGVSDKALKELDDT
jgi:hypothetical protein